MATFIPISESEIEAGSPLDALTLTKFKDNFDYLKANAGSGGGSFNWMYDIANAAIKKVQYNMDIFEFWPLNDNVILSLLKVPSGFESGVQPKIKFDSFTSGNVISQNIKFKAEVTLIKEGGLAQSNPYTQSFVQTINVPASAGTMVNFEIPLGDAGGMISSQSIEPNDILKVKLIRDIDTCTSEVKLISSTTQVIFTA